MVKIEKDVDIEKLKLYREKFYPNTKYCEEYNAITEMIKSGSRNILLTYSSAERSDKVRSAVYRYAARNNYRVKVYQDGARLYIVNLERGE